MFGMYDAERRQAIEEADRNPTSGPPLTFGETFDSAFDAQRAYQQSFSEQASRVRVLDDVIGKFRAASGEDMLNPLIFNPPTPDQMLGLPQPPQTTVTAALPTIPKMRQRYEEVRAARPELGLDPFPTDQEITTRSDAIRQRARETYERAVSREHSGFADFLGSAAGTMTDPVNAALTLLAGPAARTIVGAVLTEGAVNAAAQAAVTGLNYQARTRIDPNYTPGMAAGEIAAAGVGGAVLGGSIKGLGVLLEKFLAGTDRATLSRSMNDAINVVQSDARDAEKTPFPGDAGANAVHQETVDGVVAALRTSDTAPVVIQPEADALAQRATVPDTWFHGTTRELDTAADAPLYVSAERGVAERYSMARMTLRDELPTGAETVHTIKVAPENLRIYDFAGGQLDLVSRSIDGIGYSAADRQALRDAGFNAVVDTARKPGEMAILDRSIVQPQGEPSKVFPAQALADPRMAEAAQLRQRADTITQSAAAVEDRKVAGQQYDQAKALRNQADNLVADVRAAHAPATAAPSVPPATVTALTAAGHTPEQIAALTFGEGGTGQPRTDAGGGTATPSTLTPEALGAGPAGTIAQGAARAPLSDPTIGGLAARDLTEDAIRQAAKEPDAALAEVHAAEHLAEQAAADGRPLMVAVEDGQAPRDLRDILREADQEEAMATEIGNCVVGKVDMPE